MGWGAFIQSQAQPGQGQFMIKSWALYNWERVRDLVLTIMFPLVPELLGL